TRRARRSPRSPRPSPARWAMNWPGRSPARKSRRCGGARTRCWTTRSCRDPTGIAPFPGRRFSAAFVVGDTEAVTPAPEETTDAALAADLAADAGELLLKVREEIGFGHPWALGDAGDSLANALILRRLRAERPGDAVLSEEAYDDLVRLQHDRVWIIDPLDGTREFSTPGRDDWAVHVALWQRPTD